MSSGQDQPVSKDAILFMSHAISSHTNEVRMMHWLEVSIGLSALVVIATTNIAMLIVTLTQSNQDNRRHAEIMSLCTRNVVNENHNVNVTPRDRGIVEDTAEQLIRMRKLEHAK